MSSNPPVDLYTSSIPASDSSLVGLIGTASPSPSLTYFNKSNPIFLCNLVDIASVVPEGDFEQLLSTGCNVKLKSIIGQSSGLEDQKFYLCGERKSDIVGRSNPALYNTEDRYVYVKRKNSNQFDKWIWIGNKYPADIVTIKGDIDNETTVWNGERLYGVYNYDFFYDAVKFDDPDYIPEEGSLIYVFYDNREDLSSPIEVYGGDINLGANYFLHTHRHSGEGGGEDEGTESTSVHTHSIISTYGIANDYFITRDITGLEAEIEPLNFCSLALGYKRQVFHQYYSQTRWASFLDYSDSYPRVNYIMRPGRWKSKGSDSWANRSANLIYDDYNRDYPDEYKRWIYGGFRFKNLDGVQNIDYIKSPIHDKYNYVTSLIFKENVKFPNRIDRKSHV
jgi:hypothetical protein